MNLFAARATVEKREGRPRLSMDLALRPEGAEVDVDQLLVPRAQIGGVVHPILAVRTVDAEGAPAFPVAPVPHEHLFRAEVLLPRTPVSGDWLLVHLVLRGGNRLAYRANIEGTGAELSVSFVPQDAARNWFRLGLLGTFALLLVVRQVGNRFIDPEHVSTLRNVIELLIGSLLGAVALPSLASLNEVAQLFWRPETRVAPAIFLTISRRAWSALTFGSSILILLAALFLGHLRAPDPGTPLLAWYRDGGISKVEGGLKLNRYQLESLELGASNREGTSAFVPIGSIELETFRPLIIDRRHLATSVRESSYRVELDGGAERLLRNSNGCVASELEALLSDEKTVSQLLTATCLEPIRTALIRRFGGANGAEAPIELIVSVDRGRIRISHSAALSLAELEEAVLRSFDIGAYRHGETEGLDDSVPAIAVDGPAGRHVDSQGCLQALNLILDRWEPETSRRYSGRNAVLVVISRRLFEVCDKKWQSSTDQQIAFERIAEELASRLFDETPNGPAPVASDAALRAYFGFLLTGADRPELRSQLLLRSRNAGWRTNLEFLRSLLEGSCLEQFDATYRGQLREQFRRYRKYIEFERALKPLREKYVDESAESEFLMSLVV